MRPLRGPVHPTPAELPRSCYKERAGAVRFRSGPRVFSCDGQAPVSMAPFETGGYRRPCQQARRHGAACAKMRLPLAWGCARGRSQKWHRREPPPLNPADAAYEATGPKQHCVSSAAVFDFSRAARRTASPASPNARGRWGSSRSFFACRPSWQTAGCGKTACAAWLRGRRRAGCRSP